MLRIHDSLYSCENKTTWVLREIDRERERERERERWPMKGEWILSEKM